MHDKTTKLLGAGLAAVIGFTLSSAEPLAQDDESDTLQLPRPKVSSDESYQLKRSGADVGGYPIRIYFQTEKSFSNLDAHVFYEPLIYLETDEHGALLRHVDQDGTLTLYFSVETDTDFINGAIRENLGRTAQARSETELAPGSFKYRIGPLDLTPWFESAKKRINGERIKSDEVAKGPLNEKGRMPIFFSTGSRENAVAFVEDLQNGRDQLVFKYRFSGIRDEKCEAHLDGKDVQQIDLYKKVVGDGGRGFVARDQAASIARAWASSENLEVRCSDPEYAEWLHDKLLERLGNIHTSQLTGNELDKYLKLDPDSFKADIIKEANNISKEVVREQVLGAISRGWSKAEADAKEGGGTVGYGPFMAAGSASLADSRGASKAEARKAFVGILKKRGYLAELKDGRISIPKSVDVYTVADMRRAWEKSMKLEYVFSSSGIAEHSINLTTSTFSATAGIRQELQELAKIQTGMMETWKTKLSTLYNEMDALNSRINKQERFLSDSTERVMSDVRNSMRLAQKARDEASVAKGHALHMAEVALNTANNALAQASGIMAKIYSFDLNHDDDYSYYYNTGISSREYPAAFVTDVDFHTECSTWNHSKEVYSRVKDNDWYIIIDSNDYCDNVDITVFFFKSPLVESARRWTTGSINTKKYRKAVLR